MIVEIYHGKFKVPDVEINEELCTLCENCISTCPMGVLKIVGKDKKDMKVIQTSEICFACRNCQVACSTGAITVKGFYEVLKQPNYLPKYVVWKGGPIS